MIKILKTLNFKKKDTIKIIKKLIKKKSKKIFNKKIKY